MIAIAIAICEIGFWALLLGGLTARYPLRRPRLGAILLVAVPLVDALLLAFTAVDLARGTRAEWTHGLAAAYLGFSVVFGPMVVRDADRRFARRFGGAAPAAPQKGNALARELRLWARCLLASALAAALLGLLVLVAGDPEQTRALWAGGGWFAQLGFVSGVWLLLGPVWTAVGRAGSPQRA